MKTNGAKPARDSTASNARSPTPDFPLDVSDRVYTLRQHIDYVRAQLDKQAERPRLRRTRAPGTRWSSTAQRSTASRSLTGSFHPGRTKWQV